jgi:hypothetical protein
MIKCGHNDWYQISKDKQFEISFTPYPFKKLDLKSAIDFTVNLISSKHQNIWIALSGGMDSEFVANCFYENNVSFTPIIWKYYLNIEADYAINWCRERQIVPYIVDKELNNNNIIKILKNMTKRVNSQVWFAAISLYLAEIAKKHNGNLVTGTGVITSDNPYPLPAGNQAEFCYYDFFADLTKQHCGSFLIYTPELFYAILNEIDPTVPTQELKSSIYKVPFRPKIRPYHLLDKLVDVSSHELDERYSFDDLKNLLEKYII